MFDVNNNHLFMSIQLDDNAGGAHLLVDVKNPTNLLEVSDLNHLDSLPLNSVIIVDGASAEVRRNDAGFVFIERGYIWSLISPLDAGAEVHLRVSDRLAAEQVLRHELKLFINGLHFWHNLSIDIKERCKNLIRSFSSLSAEVFEILDSLSNAGISLPRTDADLDVSSKIDFKEVPADPHKLHDWFISDTGLGALYGENFVPREEQGVMSRDVAGALQSNTPLLVEAGTGVGKSLAYLAPLLYKANNGARVVVSTHTIALQNQLMNSDLPRLHKVFSKLKYQRLMGRNNYLCNNALKRFKERSVVTLDDAWSQVSLILWLEVTRFGMKEEVATHPALSAEINFLFNSIEPCSASLCFGKNPCYIQQARKNAQAANVVVVNHALLMNDFVSGNLLIGEYDHLVVDEAHRLPQVALDTCSVVCDISRSLMIKELLGITSSSKSTVISSANRGLALQGSKGTAAIESANELFRAINKSIKSYQKWLGVIEVEFKKHSRNSTVKQRVKNPISYFKEAKPVTGKVISDLKLVDSIHATLTGYINTMPDLSSALEESIGLITMSVEMLRELKNDIEFLTSTPESEWVYWIDPDKNNRLPAYGATQLESEKVLQPFWEKYSLAPIVTSATLSAAGDYTFIATELGLNKMSNLTSEIQSCFDYESNSRYLTVPTFPEPNDTSFQHTLIYVIKKLLQKIPRKTVILFTSYKMLNDVADALSDDTSEYEFKSEIDKNWVQEKPVVLVQGRGTVASELITRFRRESKAVLLGTNTFWEGVDFPGDELELLIVPKLPFQVPSDPWVEARCEKIAAAGNNAFMSFLVVDALLRLRQGTGRLIRTVTDKGVVVILDSRVHTKQYGLNFIKALPASIRQCKSSDDLVEVSKDFFDEIT